MEDNQFFDIDPNGQVRLLRQLDEQESFVLKVTAYDNPSNPNDRQSNSTDLKIGITKDYPPEFNTTQPPINIKEGDSFDSNPRSLPNAYDRNINEGEDEQICYYLEDDEDSFSISTESDGPRLTQLKELDREATPVIDLIVIASNLCQETAPDLESVPESSRLNVQINVDDINDVAPSFNGDTIFASISMVDYEDWTREIDFVDPDTDDTNQFSCLKTTVVPSDDGEGIDDLGDTIFSVKQEEKEKKVTLQSSLVVTSSMSGYFTFNLTVNDGVHETTAPVKIVVINEKTNRVVFTFDSSEDEVKNKKDDIRRVFSNAFASNEWKFNIDNIKQANEEVEQTAVKCHFLDDQDKPVDIADIEVNYEDARSAIKDGLIGLNLTLSPRVSVPKLHFFNLIFGTLQNGIIYGEGNNNNIGTEETNMLAIVFIILSSVVLVMFIFLAIAYYIRVQQ